MLCPYCSQDSDKVIDSRSSDGGRAIRRRRQCQSCHKRFTTYEYVEKTIKLAVVKRDGTKVPYERDKILAGIQKACFKRSVDPQAIDKLLDEVEEELFRRGEKEVASMEIGQAVAQRLKYLDQVAYVRFASVYKQFKDIDDLVEEVRDLLIHSPGKSINQGNLF